MKFINKKLAIICLSFFALFSCGEEDNLQPEGQWTLSNPLIISPEPDENIVLNEQTPNDIISFSWEASVSSAGYGVTYTVVVDTLGTTDFSQPIISVEASNVGEDTSASISFQAMDQALSFAGYPANESANLTWAVIASSLSKTAIDSQEISMQRFESEILPERLFLSGTAAENNDNLSEAIPLKRLNDSQGQPSNIYEVYTSLTGGNTLKFYSETSLPALQYGGANGTLIKNGNPINIDEDGQYRITVNLDDNTYDFLKIDYWSVVGSPINGGWGGDEPLTYQGGGIWSSSIELVDIGGFVFRANGDWSYLLKRVTGTPNTLIMESQAASQGVSFEDIPSDQLGMYIFTIDLSANGYYYTIEPDDTIVTPIETPDNLFLFLNDNLVEELTKNGDVFYNTAYLAIQSGDQLTLNSASDGSGDSYFISTNIGATGSPDSPLVSEDSELIEGTGVIQVERDQAYAFQIDFANSNFKWEYYNIFLFHWDEINQQWDNRNEYLMTYVHPYSFNTTEPLSANFDMKFFSPWDNDFGSDSPSALTGTMTNGGGSNFRNITSSGNYNVTITVANDYSAGTYEFVEQ
jgi:hypothetical protein